MHAFKNFASLRLGERFVFVNFHAKAQRRKEEEFRKGFLSRRVRIMSRAKPYANALRLISRRALAHGFRSML